MEVLECHEKYLEFSDIGFCVNFAFTPPCITILPLPLDNPDDSILSTSCSGSDRSDKYQRKLLETGRHRESTFVEIKVPVGKDNKTETLMCLGEVKEPRGSIFQRPGQGKKISSALCAGRHAGGIQRDSCWNDDGDELEAFYDEIDELIRRLRAESERLKRPLFDAGLIAIVADRYLLEVDDPTPARFS